MNGRSPNAWKTVWVVMLLAVTLTGLAGCDRASGNKGESTPAAAPTSTTTPAEAVVPVIVCLGDSITAGYGLQEAQSYPALLQARLKAMGRPDKVVNAGVSGDTSAGGLARMDWLLKQHIDVLFVALGGNDGLRGLSPEQLQANLSAIVQKGQAAGAKVVLAGMRMPTNYGPAYQKAFEAVFPAVAKQHGVPLLPFLLEGVALNPKLNQPDGIHPTAAGAKIVEANVWGVLSPVIQGK